METTFRFFDARKALLEVVKQDTTLSSLDKLQIRLAVNFRPRIRQEILGEIQAQCCLAGLVTEDMRIIPTADAASGPNPMEVDWDNILAFIQTLLPLILQIIDLFS